MASKRIDLAINGRFLTQLTTGVQRVAREITREIDALISEGRSDFSVRLVCQKDANLADLKLRSIDVQELANWPGHVWEQVLLPPAVGQSSLLCLGNTAPIACLLKRQPVAVLVHDLSYRLYPSAYRHRYRAAHTLILPLLLRRARPIITVSNTEKAMLTQLAPNGTPTIVVAQNGGWRDQGVQPAPADNRSHLKSYGLYVGSLSQRKNISGLLETMVRLAREDGMTFMLVGSTGSIMSPISLEIPSDVAANIIFRGHIEDPELLASVYRDASCLVFPSFYEASPLPPLEAMHFGCPVVASDIPAVRERCGDAAEYCDPARVDSIVAAIRRVVGDPSHAADLVARGRDWARRFSWRKQAETVLDAIASTNRDR